METQTKYPNSIPEDKRSFDFFDLMEDNVYDEEFQSIPLKIKGKATVFLVDDDPIYLMTLKSYLMEELPYLNVKVFKTGEESLQRLNESPDIIVLDYFLNSENDFAEDGIHILQKIKHRRPDTKVIMLSSQEQIKVERESMKLGAMEYISKDATAFVMIKFLIKNLTGDEVFWLD